MKNPKALRTLKYLLLCKVMSDSSSEVPSIIASKSGLNYSGPELDAMRLVAEARTQSSLTMLQVLSSLYFAVHLHLVHCVLASTVFSVAVTDSERA